jgi:hypothetical protein
MGFARAFFCFACFVVVAADSFSKKNDRLEKDIKALQKAENVMLKNPSTSMPFIDVRVVVCIHILFDSSI